MIKRLLLVFIFLLGINKLAYSAWDSDWDATTDMQALSTSAAIAQIQASLDVIGDHIELTDDGEMLIAAQPSFLVRPTSSQENIATGGVTIIWGTEIRDAGGDFASNTFTAPVTGFYLLNFGLYLEQMDTASTNIDFSIITSNRSYTQSLEPDNLALIADGLWMVSFPVIADMDAADTVTINVNQTGGAAQMDISGNSWFSGSLLN